MMIDMMNDNWLVVGFFLFSLSLARTELKTTLASFCVCVCGGGWLLRVCVCV